VGLEDLNVDMERVTRVCGAIEEVGLEIEIEGWLIFVQ
jgi:hypothetical protein